MGARAVLRGHVHHHVARVAHPVVQFGIHADFEARVAQGLELRIGPHQPRGLGGTGRQGKHAFCPFDQAQPVQAGHGGLLGSQIARQQHALAFMRQHHVALGALRPPALVALVVKVNLGGEQAHFGDGGCISSIVHHTRQVQPPHRLAPHALQRWQHGGHGGDVAQALQQRRLVFKHHLLRQRRRLQQVLQHAPCTVERLAAVHRATLPSAEVDVQRLGLVGTQPGLGLR